MTDNIRTIDGLSPEASSGTLTHSPAETYNQLSPLDTYICANLRRLRLEKGLDEQTLADRAVIEIGKISQYESGQKACLFADLWSILRVLKVDIDTFIENFYTNTIAPANVSMISKEMQTALNEIRKVKFVKYSLYDIKDVRGTSITQSQ